jgi:hypothetical protein
MVRHQWQETTESRLYSITADDYDRVPTWNHLRHLDLTIPSDVPHASKVILARELHQSDKSPMTRQGSAPWT